eukprot:Em0023g790a
MVYLYNGLFAYKVTVAVITISDPASWDKMAQVHRSMSYNNMEEISSNRNVENPFTVEVSSPTVAFPVTLINKYEVSDSDNKSAKPKRAIQSYYKQQQKDIGVIREARRYSELDSSIQIEAQFIHMLDKEEHPTEQKTRRNCMPTCIELKVSTAARLTLSINIFLFFLKTAATIQSGSLSVLSSLFDSALDLFSGTVIAVTQYLIRRYNRYHYPVGRNRLEPVSIIIIAAVMGTAALQIITNAIQNLGKRPDVNAFSGLIVALVVLLKGTLYMLCKGVKNPSVQALAVDHRNDVVSNLVTLAFGLLGTYVLPVLDAVGGILIALYIIMNWVRVGHEQLKNLVGYTADRDLINKITMIAFAHDKRVMSVDTVRAYTFGVCYLVEVDIQLDAQMPLQEAHDIGESLQKKLELLDEVERAFVHLDYETTHSPSSEHKTPQLK